MNSFLFEKETNHMTPFYWLSEILFSIERFNLEKVSTFILNEWIIIFKKYLDENNEIFQIMTNNLNNEVKKINIVINYLKKSCYFVDDDSDCIKDELSSYEITPTNVFKQKYDIASLSDFKLIINLNKKPMNEISS